MLNPLKIDFTIKHIDIKNKDILNGLASFNISSCIADPTHHGFLLNITPRLCVVSHHAWKWQKTCSAEQQQVCVTCWERVSGRMYTRVCERERRQLFLSAKWLRPLTALHQHIHVGTREVRRADPWNTFTAGAQSSEWTDFRNRITSFTLCVCVYRKEVCQWERETDKW